MTNTTTKLGRSRIIIAAIPLLLASCAPPSTPPIAGTASMGVIAGGASIAAPESAIESTEPWSYNSVEGRIVRTQHYRLFTTQTDTVLNDRIPLFLEAALGAYRTCITGADAPLPEPSLKLDTYILRSRPDWALLTKQMMGDQADLFLRIPRGGFAFGGRALLFDIGARDTPAIAAHEGWHQYTQRAFKLPLPIWLEEGIATYMEGHRFDGRASGAPQFVSWFNPERFDQLRRAAADGKLMPLMSLLDAAPQNLMTGPSSTNDSALTYYAQVWAFTHFLAEGASGKYRPALAAVLKDAADGTIDSQLTRTYGQREGRRILMARRGPGVFGAYFGDSTEASVEYDAFVKKLVEAGSRTAIIAGTSPFQQMPPRSPAKSR